MQQTKDSPAQQFAGSTKELVAQANRVEGKPSRRTRSKKSKKSKKKVPQRGVPDTVRDRQVAAQRAFDADRHNKVVELSRQLSCTRRQARKKLRLSKRWTEADLANAESDNEARMVSTPGQGKNRRKPFRTHSTSGGHRGPFTGPSNRPPGVSNKRWKEFMIGNSATL